MKITIDVDCTPEEARAFLGLPDLSPLHDVVVEEMTRRTRDAMAEFDVQEMLRQWTAGGVAGMEQLRKFFAGGFGSGGFGGSSGGTGSGRRGGKGGSSEGGDT